MFISRLVAGAEVQMMWDIFLLPYTLLGWMFKYLFSFMVWFTIVMWIHYSVRNKFTWRDINVFKYFSKKQTKKYEEPEDYIL